jgi:hypothetical protein
MTPTIPPFGIGGRALRGSPPAAGTLEWRMVRDGFEAGELAVIVQASELDRILICAYRSCKISLGG